MSRMTDVMVAPCPYALVIARSRDQAVRMALAAAPAGASSQPVPSGASNQPVPSGASSQPVLTGASDQPVPSVATADGASAAPDRPAGARPTWRVRDVWQRLRAAYTEIFVDDWSPRRWMRARI